MTEELTVSERGQWSRTSAILYGFAIYPFQPATWPSDHPKYPGQLINPYQVPLEVADEIYAFETWTPATRPAGPASEIWFRGYVVSSSRDTGKAAQTAPQEAEHSHVYVGIWPANHCRIREQLQDTDERLVDLESRARTPPSPATQRARAMSVVHEVDEEAVNMTPTMEHLPMLPEGDLSAPDGRRLPRQPQASAASQASSARAERTKPSPPLPSLKCGDETEAGVEEPLIDEISSAIREWSSLLHVYLSKRQYTLFHTTTSHVQALHAGRRKLLGESLRPEETATLRKDLIDRLTKGNKAQGLDIMVRDVNGSLVDVDIPEEADMPSAQTVSAARIFASQVALAYEGAVSSLGQPDHALAALGSSDIAPTSEGAHLHHVYVEVRALIASFCTPGETAELYFSLFSRSDMRFVTEDFCVIVDQHGHPQPSGRATLFADLSRQDIQDDLFLVCRVVKNGTFKSHVNALGTGPTSPNLESHSDSGSRRSSVMANGDAPAGSAMLRPLPGARQSARRPFGCAVLDISHLAKATASVNIDRSMPIFVPVSENAFSTLHEDIIGNRAREFVKNARADNVIVRVAAFEGTLVSLINHNAHLLANASISHRLGFPDVVEPDVVRNDIYIKLWSGEFGSSTKTAAGQGSRSVELTVELRRSDGTAVPGVISRGAKEPSLSNYTSMVFRSNNAPTYGELLKISLPVERMEPFHLFITFRHRSGKDTKLARESAESPFAFSYLPIFDQERSFTRDGTHSLVLYRHDHTAAMPSMYTECAPCWTNAGSAPELPLSLARTMSVTKDSMVVRTFLCSTRFTQNEVLLRLFNFETSLLPDAELLKSTLMQLRYCSEAEIAKHLRPVLDALFGILARQNELSDIIFGDLITILAIIQDRRFVNFRPVLEVYIAQHFSGSTIHTHLLRSMQLLLSKRDDSEAAHMLRAALKVWDPLFRIILRSREIQRERDVGMDFTHDHVEGVFRNDVTAVLGALNQLMKTTTPASLIGTQILAVQNFGAILPSLRRILSEDGVLSAVISFCEALPSSINKGKAAIWKLVLLIQIARSSLMESAASRTTLVPHIARWTKPFLAHFDERLTAVSKDSENLRDQTRIIWLETSRLAVSVIATLSDRLHTAMADPAIRNSRTLLGQEQDNAEYVLNLLPRLLEVAQDLAAPAGVAALTRQKAVISTLPVVFPASYPFTLVSYPPATGQGTETVLRAVVEPTASSLVPSSEATVVAIALMQAVPQKALDNFLITALEVEGRPNFARFIGQLSQFMLTTVQKPPWPASWLNVCMLAHTVAHKLADSAARILLAHFIPPHDSTMAFDYGVWRSFSAMLLGLLASNQLVIEEFSPQKRRAVWRLASDLRGRGAKVALRLWNALGSDTTTRKMQTGGFQIQLGPSVIESVLELCLSHHDELRSTAVSILASLLVNEWTANGNLETYQADVIDRLDRLFSVRTHNDVSYSQSLFVNQLRDLFSISDISAELRTAVSAFLAAVSNFLELLIGIRSLPEGDQWIDDRIVGTLKLMSFVRGVSASPIFIRYIDQIKTYHMATHSWAEAGLTLKLHADLYVWDTAKFVDAIPDANLPRQSHFARKAALYEEIIDLLQRGRAWESALSLCKELQEHYEYHVYSYPQLSSILARQSALYAKIAAETRVYPMCFRVGFFGRGFPKSVQNKQFVYLGHELERFSAFCDRMQNKHPTATLVKNADAPDTFLLNSDVQLLHVCVVTPEPDRTLPIFTNPNVPAAVRAHYEANGTNVFSSSRAVERPVSASLSSVSHGLLERWTEKTIIVCNDAFPAVLRRTEVTEIRIMEQSPIDLAIMDVDAKRVELSMLERRYLLASQVENAQLNTNVLSAALNSAVDTDDTGIPLYRKVFFSGAFASSESSAGSTAAIRTLRDAIDLQYKVIRRCMSLHKALCPTEMQPFHETLQRFLHKNFAEERSRVPPEPFPPEGMIFPRPPSASMRIIKGSLASGESVGSSSDTSDNRLRSGSVTTSRSRDVHSPLPAVNGNRHPPETEKTEISSASGAAAPSENGHATRFSESLVRSESLRSGATSPVPRSPASRPGEAQPARSNSERANKRLSLLGSRIGDSLRRRKPVPEGANGM